MSLISLSFLSISYGQAEVLVLQVALEKLCNTAMKDNRDSSEKAIKEICRCYAQKHYDFAIKNRTNAIELKWAIKELDPRSSFVKENIPDPNSTIADLDFEMANECYNIYK